MISTVIVSDRRESYYLLLSQRCLSWGIKRLIKLMCPSNAYFLSFDIWCCVLNTARCSIALASHLANVMLVNLKKKKYIFKVYIVTVLLCIDQTCSSKPRAYLDKFKKKNKNPFFLLIKLMNSETSWVKVIRSKQENM